jgi:hypothetical protein
MGVIPSAPPAGCGIQCAIVAPFGKYTAPKRNAGLACALAIGVSAGTIDSRNGSASVVPRPWRKTRRGSDFFVMNIERSLSPASGPRAVRPAVRRRPGRPWSASGTERSWRFPG